ncbi:MAG: endonuclease III [Candidatus Omnitrophica bacterium 4484_171]|nr:MAG: endonuclease III [Candidatus Omnitrophica bacterium 4484_171]
MVNSSCIKILRIIENQVSKVSVPYVTMVSNRKGEPFRILVSCILSLRTRDDVTAKASESLFKIIKTPYDILKLDTAEIAEIIYPVGFYRNKARVLRGIAQIIVDKYNGRVPSNEEALLSFNGVGPKTANLVLGLGFGIPAICVDTHVHRISNRLGWVSTRNPYDTENALKGVIARKWWIRLNTILAAFGQNICLPISPWCSRCEVRSYCRKKGVEKNR